MGASKERRTSQHGVTLVELICVLAVMAIVGTVAIPSLRDLRQVTDRATTLNAFVHSVLLARSEAMKRNVVVAICRSTDGRTCANANPNWNSGWIVFENLDDDQPANTDPGESVLFHHDALTSGTLTSNRASFSFRSYNQGGANGTVIYCPAPGSKKGRAVIMSLIGRPRTSDKDANGKPLKC